MYEWAWILKNSMVLFSISLDCWVFGLKVLVKPEFRYYDFQVLCFSLTFMFDLDEDFDFDIEEL